MAVLNVKRNVCIYGLTAVIITYML